MTLAQTLAPANQDTSERPPRNANQTGQATRTHSLQNKGAPARKTTRRACEGTIPAPGNENSTCRSIKNTLPQRIPMAHAHRRTVADGCDGCDGCERLPTVANGCKRLQTVANSGTTPREQASTPRPPLINGNPFATHSGKEELGRNEAQGTCKCMLVLPRFAPCPQGPG